MSRILLFHWNTAEAGERAVRLRRAGHSVRVYAEQGGKGFGPIRENPPDAFVIDLGRLPSHGREMASWIRRQKATRHVPIVFADGDPVKVESIRKVLPDAVYTGWGGVGAALRRAMARPPADPVVPSGMERYAGRPLAKKLGIKAGSVLALLGAPKGFEKTLGVLPDDVRIRRRAQGPADLLLLFVRKRGDLARRFPAAERAMGEGGGLWIVWPKKASGVGSDLTQNVVRAFGLDTGLVDYKICAVDATWSGLLFARRKIRK